MYANNFFLPMCRSKKVNCLALQRKKKQSSRHDVKLSFVESHYVITMTALPICRLFSLWKIPKQTRLCHLVDKCKCWWSGKLKNMYDSFSKWIFGLFLVKRIFQYGIHIWMICFVFMIADCRTHKDIRTF